MKNAEQYGSRSVLSRLVNVLAWVSLSIALGGAAGIVLAFWVR